MNAFVARTGRCVLLACAAFAMSPAFAQQPQIDVNAQPVIIEPLPPPGSPVRSRGSGAKRSDAAEIGRDLDAASRRVQSDNLRNEIQRGDDAMERDRVSTDRQRAASADPQESARLRREYDQRLAEHERWRTDKERQRQDLESMEKEAKDVKKEKDTYRPVP